MSVEQLGAGADGPAPSPPYGDGSRQSHADTPDLNANEERRAA
jgi:hypothetical protein